MTKYQALTIYAMLIIATGIVLSSLAYYPTRAIQYVVGVGMLLSAVFALYTSYKSQKSQIPMNYHGLHALGMMVYGLAILFWANNIQTFFDITVFFLLYYGMAEIILCFQIFMMKQLNINSQIILFRFIIGFFIVIGSIYILATHHVQQNNAFLVSGAVFIFSGIYLIVFKTALKRAENIITHEYNGLIDA